MMAKDKKIIKLRRLYQSDALLALVAATRCRNSQAEEMATGVYISLGPSPSARKHNDGLNV